MNKLFSITLWLLSLIVPPELFADGAITIRQSGFADFSAGSLGNSGANLYVSKAGVVQVINHWDLNRDGFVDVLMSNDHDLSEIVDAFIYWNGPKGFRPLLPELWRERPLAEVVFGLLDRAPAVTRLPTFSGGRAVVSDLNRDGFLDVVFPNFTHNYPGIRQAYVYWGSSEGFGSTRRTELPTNWAAGVAAADLNKDGYPELIFANQGVEPGYETTLPPTPDDAFIYWGSATGLDAARPTPVASRGAREVNVADLNKDEHPDLLFVNNRPDRNELQIFWGDAARNYRGRTTVVPVPKPTSIRTADVNGDGYPDAIVTTAGRGANFPPEAILPAGAKRDDVFIYIFKGGASGLDAARPMLLPSLESRDATVGDFNADGHADIAVANSSDGTSSAVPSYVYWGGPAGPSPERRTLLPTLGAASVAAADFNADGYPDLVFGNTRNDETFDVTSYIYWGSKNGYAPHVRTELQSFGALDAQGADFNGDGRPDLLIVNQFSGKVDGRINSRVFWGNPQHHYSSALMTTLPSDGAYDSTAADFNDDGYPDIVFANSSQKSASLYWGGKEGYSPARRQMLPVEKTLTSSSADLNRDGYLDLVFTATDHSTSTGTILWGAAGGYTEESKTVLPLKPRASLINQIADLNRDGHLDLIFPDGYFDQPQIFWGGPDGYSAARSWSQRLAPGNLKLADLNGDNYLDFIFAAQFDPEKRSYDSQTRIYWGTAEGVPSPKDHLELDAYGSIECSVADLNHDRRLDLVCSNYMSSSTRSLPLFIFWGDAGGKYSNANRTDLPAESSAGIQLLDLNKDNYPEIIVHNHLKDGVHAIESYIYWNGPAGFDRDRRSALPGLGPHFSQTVDAGNLYTRRLEEEYISAPLEIPAGKRVREISWEVDEPHGARLEMAVRTANSPAELNRADWVTYSRGAGAPPTLSARANRRWVQYRATFRSPDAGAWPVLRAVEFKLQESE